MRRIVNPLINRHNYAALFKMMSVANQGIFPVGKRPSLRGIIGGRAAFITIFTAILAGCSSNNSSGSTTLNTTTSNDKQTYSSKSSINDLSSSSGEKKSSVSALRIQILRETALSVGARGGLAYRTKQINKLLSSYDAQLARVFNFRGMLLEHDVLPPVLVEARNALSLTGNDIIRIADVNYQILHQAKFVTSPPHWRDYLWMNYSSPESPDKSLLPANKGEKIVWQKYIDEGWQAGLAQAESIFKENISRLQRDYTGMIRYRKLLAQQMVSPPYVASLDMGVTGNDSNLTVNDRMLRITAFPSFQTDGGQWKTEIQQHE